MKSVTIKELFSAMFLFEIGNTILFAHGISAKQDSWIAVLLAMISALPLLYLYIFLYNTYNINLTEILKVSFGKIIGRIISIIYMFYFFYMAARVTRDYLELSTSSIFPLAPIKIIAIFLMIVTAYFLLFDISVTLNVANILLPFFLSLISIIFIFAFTIPGYSFSKIFPIFEGGIMPVLKAAYPRILTFPFGEMFVFMMIFPEIKCSKDLFKYSSLVYLITGILLAFNDINIISAIGVKEASRVNFPFYTVTRLITLGFLRSLDSLYIALMIIGNLIKIIIFAFAGLKACQSVFDIKEYKFLIIPTATIVYALSIVTAESYFIQIPVELPIMALYVHVPLLVIVPLILLIVYFLKKVINSCIT
ncbi:GerAB/ArcD/ProY family transporter [Thermoanaerobacterium saccharolyticum]|uniref:Spore germination protein n=2 Tax=Thermoanaerobacterium TaxID=28895 RepID=W9EBT7_9THEO|nr:MULTISPECIES: GerAB/ArcD/ProY family transporter [Thermoanaerobacterium]AFK87290.1 spore germination protein [Thermoanaerobacterium saccharolyticum JW/SL-YS485]ETO39588.1 spore germination protein [Thermoanaerobacterium aotearoense SCUT27]